jgi:HAD superfamily hydrolase (TIGR01509 family)
MIMTAEYSDPGEVYSAARAQLGLVGSKAKTAIAETWDAQENEARLVPGVIETLHAFLAQGCRLALLSNIWTPYFRSVHRLLGSFFDAHIPAQLQMLSCREGLAKPAPALFAELLSRVEVRPTEALMVGDSYEKDIEPAILCGMRTVWLLRDPIHEMPMLLRILNSDAAAPMATVRSLADIASESSLLSRLLPQLTASTSVPGFDDK